MIPINQDRALDERHMGGLCEEASTCGFNGYYPLYWGNGAANGVWVRRLDGQLAPFRHTVTQRDLEGDIQMWYFMHKHEMLTIFND
jgi:hypothetical protein